MKKQKPVLVRIDHRLLHYIPFSVAKVRQPKMEAEKTWDWGGIRMKCADTVNTRDADVLFALVHLARVAKEDCLEQGRTYDGRAVVGVKTRIRDVARLAGITNRCFLNESIARLAAHTITFTTVEGKEKMITNVLRMVEGYEVDPADPKNIRYLLNEKFRQDCENGLRVNLTRLVAIKGNTAKALYLYLIGTDRISFRAEALAYMIGVKREKQSKGTQELKEAFRELKAKSVLRDWVFVRKTPKKQSHFTVVRFG